MLDFSLTRPTEGQKIVDARQSNAKLNMRRAGGHIPLGAALYFAWHRQAVQFLPYGEPVTANERYVITTLECPRCKTKQKVHVSTRSGGVQVGDQTIPCIQCDLDFNVTVPDRIIRGPFPA